MYAFERFSDAAKMALMLAQEEAQHGSTHIGTEHLLLAFTRDPECLAAQVLAALGASEPALRERLAVEPSPPAATLLPTDRVKKVIELAFEESVRARRREVTTADLLIAVLTEGAGRAAEALDALGVRLGDVRAEVARLAVAGAAERTTGRRVRPPGPVSELRPVAEGVRVLVHDPDPPHRLWEGRVVVASDAGFEVDVPDRPAGTRMKVEPGLLHPVPGGPTFLCPYCRG